MAFRFLADPNDDFSGSHPVVRPPHCGTFASAVEDWHALTESYLCKMNSLPTSLQRMEESPSAFKKNPAKSCLVWSVRSLGENGCH